MQTNINSCVIVFGGILIIKNNQEDSLPTEHKYDCCITVAAVDGITSAVTPL